MRTITAKIIKDTVADLCIRANIFLRPDVLQGLQQALARETKPRAKKILEAIIENARIARRQGLAVCQDTGMPLVFAEVGRKVKLRGDLRAAINKGIELGYRRGFLRNSIVKDPLVRGSWGYVPSVIHVDIVKGDRLKLTVLPKGFGCENKSQLKMFNPTAGIST